jgi:hypothetical protein
MVELISLNSDPQARRLKSKRSRGGFRFLSRESKKRGCLNAKKMFLKWMTFVPSLILKLFYQQSAWPFILWNAAAAEDCFQFLFSTSCLGPVLLLSKLRSIFDFYQSHHCPHLELNVSLLLINEFHGCSNCSLGNDFSVKA